MVILPSLTSIFTCRPIRNQVFGGLDKVISKASISETLNANVPLTFISQSWRTGSGPNF